MGPAAMVLGSVGYTQITTNIASVPMNGAALQGWSPEPREKQELLLNLLADCQTLALRSRPTPEGLACCPTSPPLSQGRDSTIQAKCSGNPTAKGKCLCQVHYLLESPLSC